MWKNLKHKFTSWLIRFVIQRLINLGVDTIRELPWESYGLAANHATDDKFTPEYANQIQMALGEGLIRLKAGLTA